MTGNGGLEEHGGFKRATTPEKPPIRPFLGEKTSAVVVEKTDRTRVKTLTTVRKKCCTKKPKKVVKIDNLHERRLI